MSPRARAKLTFSTCLQTPRLGRLSRKFLERLHAAAQGIPPFEYAKQESERAKAAKSAYAEHHGKEKKEPVVVLFPTRGDVEGSAEKQAKYHVKWEGEPWEALKTGDLRGTVLRQLDLKSSRINGSTVRSFLDSHKEGKMREERGGVLTAMFVEWQMMLILHQAPTDAEEEEPHEAFLYIGSHQP